MLNKNFLMRVDAMKIYFPIHIDCDQDEFKALEDSVYSKGVTWGRLLSKKGEIPSKMELKITTFPIRNSKELEEYLNSIFHNAMLEGYLEVSEEA